MPATGVETRPGVVTGVPWGEPALGTTAAGAVVTAVVTPATLVEVARETMGVGVERMGVAGALWGC